MAPLGAGDESPADLSARSSGAAEQLLVDAESKRYRPDDEGASVTRVVNPGNELTATLLFDVPPSVSPDEAELRRLPGSPGARMLLPPR